MLVSVRSCPTPCIPISSMPTPNTQSQVNSKHIINPSASPATTCARPKPASKGSFFTIDGGTAPALAQFSELKPCPRSSPYPRRWKHHLGSSDQSLLPHQCRLRWLAGNRARDLRYRPSRQTPCAVLADGHSPSRWEPREEDEPPSRSRMDGCWIPWLLFVPWLVMFLVLGFKGPRDLM